MQPHIYTHTHTKLQALSCHISIWLRVPALIFGFASQTQKIEIDSPIQTNLSSLGFSGLLGWLLWFTLGIVLILNRCWSTLSVAWLGTLLWRLRRFSNILILLLVLLCIPAQQERSLYRFIYTKVLPIKNIYIQGRWFDQKCISYCSFL